MTKTAGKSSSGSTCTTRTMSFAPKRDIKDVWIEYKKTRSEALRNILMENYLHLVRYNAERIHVKLPDEVELDDLMSSGIFGLMDAIAAFDMERGVKFETYCAPRIRGAILDELRSMDWVPRLVRSRAHKMDGATKQLEVELGRAPTNEELAKRLQVPMAEFDKMAKDASAVGVVSLSRKVVRDRQQQGWGLPARSTSSKTSAAPTPSARSSARTSRSSSPAASPAPSASSSSSTTSKK